MIVYNAIKTPDGSVLESRYRHDFVVHQDKNGKTYGVDGGHEYLRRIGEIDDCEDLSLDSRSCTFEEVRENLKWVSYKGWIKIKDLEEDHLDALLEYSPVSEELKVIFIREKQYRNLDEEGL